MNYMWAFAVVVASFAICGVTSSSKLSEGIAQDQQANQRVRISGDIEEVPDRKWTTLTEALDIFNVRYLANNWTEGNYPVQEQCAKDITRYIEGLKKHEVWALKGTLNQANLCKNSGFRRLVPGQMFNI